MEADPFSLIAPPARLATASYRVRTIFLISISPPRSI